MQNMEDRTAHVIVDHARDQHDNVFNITAFDLSQQVHAVQNSLGDRFDRRIWIVEAIDWLDGDHEYAL